MKKKYLILTTVAGNQFSLESQYQQDIQAFVNLFGIRVLKTNKKPEKLMTLNELATSFCLDGSDKPMMSIETTDNLIRQIDDYIQDNLLEGKIITIKELCKKFRDAKYSCIYSRMDRKKKELERSGKKIEKIGSGRYRLGAIAPSL